MSVSYDSYKIFYYVAYYQNITLAAKALFLTQPTVSHYILNLEKELNCKLFIRSKKGMRLSPEGELLFEHISKAYNEISQGEEKLKEKYPNIQLRICNTTCQLVGESIRSGSLDFAIMTTPFTDNGLSAHRLVDFSMACIAGPTFAHLMNRPLTYQEVSKYPMICLEPETSGRQYLETLFASHGVRLKPDMELSSADLITPMAEQNMGIGFVPRIFADQALRIQRVVELTFTDPLPNRSICMLSDSERQQSFACQKFMAELKNSKEPS